MWPTTTLPLSDLPRTVRGRPLASAGVCGGCYSFSYSPTRGRGGGGPRRELQREWEPGIASRRSYRFGDSVPPLRAADIGMYQALGRASSVLSCSVLPCWLGQLIRHVLWSAPHSTVPVCKVSLGYLMQAAGRVQGTRGTRVAAMFRVHDRNMNDAQPQGLEPEGYGSLWAAHRSKGRKSHGLRRAAEVPFFCAGC